MRLLKTLLLLTLLLPFTNSYSQQRPFADEIAKFKESDKQSFPPANAILFIGSSTFRKWENMESYFPKHKVINRGFGGSTLPDVIAYAHDIIFPYKPRQVIFYCGDNDLASSDTVTAYTVYKRFVQLYFTIMQKLPNADIAYVSIKPSPSRERLMGRMKTANALIRSFLSQKQHTAYIDVFREMLLPDGKPRPDIFLEDKLHMNDKGYAIWQRVIEPYLK